MSLIDALAQQAQAAALDQSPGKGMAEAVAKCIQLNQQQQQLNNDHMEKLKQLEQAANQKLMDMQMHFLDKAADFKNVSPGGRKYAVDYADRIGQKLGYAPMSEDVRGMFIQDQEFASKYSFIRSAYAKALTEQNFAKAAELQQQMASLMGQSGEDAAFGIDQMNDLVKPFVTLAGQINQGKGQELSALRQQFNRVDSDLASTYNEATNLATKRGVTLGDMPEFVEIAKSKPFSEADGQASIAEKLKATRYLRSQITRLKEQNAKEQFQWESDERNYSRNQGTQNKIEGFMKDYDEKKASMDTGIQQFEEAIKTGKRIPVEQAALGLAGINQAKNSISNADAARFGIPSSLWGSFKNAMSWAFNEPGARDLSDADKQQLIQNRDVLVRAATAVRANELVRFAARMQSSNLAPDRASMRKGGEGYKTIQNALNELSEQYGFKIDLQQAIKRNTTGKGVLKAPGTEKNPDPSAALDAWYADQKQKIQNNAVASEAAKAQTLNKLTAEYKRRKMQMRKK